MEYDHYDPDECFELEGDVVECPWCGQEVEIKGDRVTADCTCGTKIHIDGSYRLRCPVCDKHHEGGREGATKCAQYQARSEWLKRMATIISTIPYDIEGSEIPLDMGIDKASQWMWVKDSILERDSLTCTSCGKSESTGHYAIQVHHIIPKWAGGTDHPRNLRTLCTECHTNIHSQMGGFNPSKIYREIVEGKQSTINH